MIAPNRPDEGLVWPPHGGHVWLRRKVEAPAETIEELAAREGLTIKGVARQLKPPKKPKCPYEPGSYLWFKWVEEEAFLEGVREAAIECQRRGRIRGKLYN